jgi:hypothetical protein
MLVLENVVHSQWKMKNVSMDMLDSPAVPDGCMASKNGRSQQLDGQCSLLGQPDVI